MPTPNPSPSPLPPERTALQPLAFREWWDDLIWPKVLTGAGLGLRPNRLGLAFFVVIAAALVLGLGNQIDRKIARADSTELRAIYGGPGLGDVPPEAIGLTGRLSGGLSGWASYQWAQAGTLPWRWFIAGPIELARNFPITTFVAGPIFLVALLITLGAVSRMAAVEASHGRRIAWTEGVAFSASRWGSLLGAVLLPLILIWIIALAAACFGFLLLQVPGLNIVGAILFVLILVLAVLAALAAGAFIVGAPLLAPAVMCEGTDAIDAVQRVFAYVTGRLPRMLLYWGLAALGVIFITFVVRLLMTWSVDLAARSAHAWMSSANAEMTLGSAAARFMGHDPGRPEGTWGVASWILGLWFAIPLGLIGATLVSCATSAATVAYLAMRQVCDGQDMAELWEPGAVEASMADAVAARGELAKQSGAPESTPLASDSDD